MVVNKDFGKTLASDFKIAFAACAGLAENIPMPRFGFLLRLSILAKVKSAT